MVRQKTIWCDTKEKLIVFDTIQEEAKHEEHCPTCRREMGDSRFQENATVRGHYGFIRRPEPAIQREIPVWHGPIRVRRPVRTVVWWEKRDPSGKSNEFEDINLHEETTQTGEQFLQRLFGEPDPAACGVLEYLTVADMNSLKYTCKSFKIALSGDGAWGWMLAILNFGNELDGGSDAFNGLRRLTNRLPFWDTPSVQNVINGFEIRDILVNINLDYTAIDASCIQWLLNNFHALKRISVRYCRPFKLGDFLTVLEDYAMTGKEASNRLERTFIDFWGVSEIYSVISNMLIEQALIEEVNNVAAKLRCIARLIDSTVFLCYRNHYEEGIWGPDRIKYRRENGDDAVFSTFYPSETVLLTCGLCKKMYERRWCLRCLQANICTFCNEYHCMTCDPNSYASSIAKGHAFTLARLQEFEPCCSEVPVAWNLKHYFHEQCAIQARILDRCELCEKFICWNIAGLHCPRCNHRQCPHSPSYNMRMCQFCKTDYAYSPERRSIPPKAAQVLGERRL